MQSRWLYLPAAFLFAVLTSCSNTGGSTAGNPGGTGPFDARGNYVEAWADSPSKWRSGSQQIVEAQPDRPAADVPVVPPTVLAANETPKPVATRTTTVYRPKTTSTTVSNTRPKPKAVAKAKPKSTRHTVRSGDSLYAIAKRYGTTASAVQKANGLKGTTIRPGQSLSIPK